MSFFIDLHIYCGPRTFSAKIFLMRLAYPREFDMPVVHNMQNFNNSHEKQIIQNIIQTNKIVFSLFIESYITFRDFYGVRYNASGKRKCWKLN